MARARYTPISSFWVFLVPAVVLGAIYYAYTQPGFVGYRIQRALSPILDPLIRWFDRLFPTL